MFSSRKRESYDPDREPELLLSHDENPRVQALAKNPVPELLMESRFQE